MAVERNLPAFLFIEEGIDIPDDIQELLDKVNVYYKEIISTHKFPKNVEELKIFMEDYNDMILRYGIEFKKNKEEE